uniref:Uncharacterized protein n=1 Tax=Cannabis sativa TaxID=3483 RepID=A0A803RAA6_CANSA
MMNQAHEEKVNNMEFTPPSDHLCYVRCNFCTTVLAVALPYKRFLDTVTVKCGHCSNLSFLSTRPTPLQPHQFLDQYPLMTHLPGFCNNDHLRKGSSSGSSPSSTTSGDPMSSTGAPFVVKPPEKKHRLPSAYNRFMKFNASNRPILRFHIGKLSALQPRIGLGTFLIRLLDQFREATKGFCSNEKLS